MSNVVFLLSIMGERHEDRVPYGIFSDAKTAINKVRNEDQSGILKEEIVSTDYDAEAISLYSEYFDTTYLVEKFKLNWTGAQNENFSN